MISGLDIPLKRGSERGKIDKLGKRAWNKADGWIAAREPHVREATRQCARGIPAPGGGAGGSARRSGSGPFRLFPLSVAYSTSQFAAVDPQHEIARLRSIDRCVSPDFARRLVCAECRADSPARLRFPPQPAAQHDERLALSADRSDFYAPPRANADPRRLMRARVTRRDDLSSASACIVLRALICLTRRIYSRSLITIAGSLTSAIFQR